MRAGLVDRSTTLMVSIREFKAGRYTSGTLGSLSASFINVAGYPHDVEGGAGRIVETSAQPTGS